MMDHVGHWPGQTAGSCLESDTTCSTAASDRRQQARQVGRGLGTSHTVDIGSRTKDRGHWPGYQARRDRSMMVYGV